MPRARHPDAAAGREWLWHHLTTLGLTCGINMLPGGCEVQAEQPSEPPAYPVRFKPLLERAVELRAEQGSLLFLTRRNVPCLYHPG